MLALGSSNKVIAYDLSITEATVKVHVKSILRKIHASNRTQAATWAGTNQANASDAPQQPMPISMILANGEVAFHISPPSFHGWVPMRWLIAKEALRELSKVRVRHDENQPNP